MCGVVGLWNWYHDRHRNAEVVQAMMAAVPHRGPDANGTALATDWGVGHVRLSIVDLSRGAQPIYNEDHSLCVIGNNEIYNAPELRQRLEGLGHRFRSHSDTEVALHAWEEWGEAAFEKFNGMFALVFIDLKKRRCVLVRDPMGIKPLHLLRQGKRYAFASEIKSLLQIPDFTPSPDFDAVHLFMNFRYVPNEQTLFQNVERVAPGSYVVLDARGDSLTREYYRLPSTSDSPPAYGEAVEQLRTTLGDSVRRHLMADVEVASYLSGGIDSSAVSRLASRHTPHLRTYCLGFGEPTDENSDAQKVAQWIGSRHTELYIGESPLDRYQEILWHVEEPKINLMQGFALAERVGADVKVALSGLGGDELFAGYVNNDLLFPMTLFAGVTRNRHAFSLSGLQKRFPHPQLDHYFRAVELGLNTLNPVSFYAILRNGFDHNTNLLHSLYEDPPERWHHASTRALTPYFDDKDPDLLNAILRLEARTKLVNDFLLTEDRVSMAHALEVRVPFLDKELVDFAHRLPSAYKYRLGSKKRILKEALEKDLPRWVLEKKKWGFSINPHLLFEKQLKSFAQSVLTEASVRSLGLFSWKWISGVLEAPPSPKMRWHYFNLWAMAGFTLWYETFFKQQRRDFRSARYVGLRASA